MVVRYEVGSFQASILFRLKGSVFKDAFLWAGPCALLSFALKILDQAGELGILHRMVNPVANNAAFSGISFLVGFIIVFRTGQSYTRFMDALNSTHQMMGEWLDCACSIVAFCKIAGKSDEEKDAFLHTVVRLFSVLSASALQELTKDQGGLKRIHCDEGGQRVVYLETIDRFGLDPDTVSALDEGKANAVLLVYQWIQQLVLQKQSCLLSTVPPPILARAFNELGAGMTKFHDTLILSQMPFPFPYAQTTVTLLIMHWFLTPLVMVQWTNYPWAAAVFTFVQVFILWALNAIATGIERPFAGQPNDINPYAMQKSMNMQLMNLVNPKANKLPALAAGTSLVFADLQKKWVKDRKRNEADYTESLRQAGWRERLRRLRRWSRESIRLPATSEPAVMLADPLVTLKEQRCPLPQHEGRDGQRPSTGSASMDHGASGLSVDRRISSSTWSRDGRTGMFSPPSSMVLDQVQLPEQPRDYVSGPVQLPPGPVISSVPESASSVEIDVGSHVPSDRGMSPRQAATSAALCVVPVRGSGPVRQDALDTLKPDTEGSHPDGAAALKPEWPEWPAGHTGALSLGVLPGVPDVEGSRHVVIPVADDAPCENVLSRHTSRVQTQPAPAPMPKKANDAADFEGVEAPRLPAAGLSRPASRTPSASLLPQQAQDFGATVAKVSSGDSRPPLGDGGPDVPVIPQVDSTPSILEVQRAPSRHATGGSSPSARGDEVRPIKKNRSQQLQTVVPPVIRVESVHSIDDLDKAPPSARVPDPPVNSPPRMQMNSTSDLAQAGSTAVGPMSPPDSGRGAVAASAGAAVVEDVPMAAQVEPPPEPVWPEGPAVTEPAVTSAPAVPMRQAELPQRLLGGSGSMRDAVDAVVQAPGESQSAVSRSVTGVSVHSQGAAETATVEATTDAAVGAAAGSDAAPSGVDAAALPEALSDPAMSRTTSRHISELLVVQEAPEPRPESASQGSRVETAPEPPEAAPEPAEDPEAEDVDVPGVHGALERMESDASELLGGNGGFMPF